MMLQLQQTILTVAFCLVGLLTLPPIVQGSPYTLSDDRVRSLDVTPVLGRGYSIMTNTFLSTCLDVEQETAPSYNYDYSHTDFTRSYDIQLDLTGGKLPNTFAYYWVKEQVSAEYRRTKTKDQKYFVVSTMRIERYYSSLNEGSSPLTDSAYKILNRQDYVGFFKACGPNYVRSIRRAQEVTAVFSYTSASLELAQEFATGLKTSNNFGVIIQEDDLLKTKFNPITDSLEIKILGFGLGLNSQGSGSLVATRLEEYNNIARFAFQSMTQNQGGSRNIGMVYGIEVAPWVDNVNFQVVSHLHEEAIEIPIPRSMLKKAILIDPNDTITSSFTIANRAAFRCKDPMNLIDKFGYCCDRYSMFDNDAHEYNTIDLNERICKPLRSLDKAVVKNNMSTNGEFIARLDSVIRYKLNQFSTLEKCASNIRKIPEKYDYHILRAQDTVKYDGSIEASFTVAELKLALDPFQDYSMVKHMGRELDEFMEMYYVPCIAALFGSKVGLSSDVEVSHFMAYPWHTHEECTMLSCLSNSMRWDRDTGGCVPSLISGALAPGYDSGDSNCSYDVGASEETEVCKYRSDDLDSYHTQVTNCWDETLPVGKVDYFMEHFCMPELTGKKVEPEIETQLRENLSTHCTNRTTANNRRKLTSRIENIKRR